MTMNLIVLNDYELVKYDNCCVRNASRLRRRYDEFYQVIPAKRVVVRGTLEYPILAWGNKIIHPYYLDDFFLARKSHVLDAYVPPRLQRDSLTINEYLHFFTFINYPNITDNPTLLEVIETVSCFDDVMTSIIIHDVPGIVIVAQGGDMMPLKHEIDRLFSRGTVVMPYYPQYKHGEEEEVTQGIWTKSIVDAVESQFDMSPSLLIYPMYINERDALELAFLVLVVD